MPKRCALGCLPSGISYHQFPHPKRCPDTFKEWVKIVGGKLESPSDYEFYKKKVICDIHFTPEDRNRCNRLNASCVPSLYLNASEIAPRTEPMPILPMDIQPPKSTQVMEGGDAVLHVFPKPKDDLDQFNIWKNAIGGDILSMDQDTVFQLRRICHLHFESRFYTRSKRLCFNAVPTLHLKGSKSPDQIPGPSAHNVESDTVSASVQTSPNQPQTGTSDKVDYHRTLHVFPNPTKDKERFNEWVFFIKGDIISMSDEEIHRLRRVCHAHFEEKFCCRFNRISKDAVPTLRLPGSLAIQKYTFVERRPLKQMQGGSNIPSTSRDQPIEDPHSVVLHAFPNPVSDEERFRKWVTNTGLSGEDDTYIFKNRRICHLHFEKIHHYPKNRLSRIAVPRLHLEGVKHTDDSTGNVDQESPNAEQDDAGDVAGAESGVAVESPCPSPEVVEELEEEATVLPVTCDQCHQVVEGHRWVCVSCSGLVLCGSCVTHGVHPTCYVLRVPPLRPQWEVQAVLRAVRQALAMSAFADRLAEPLCDYEIALPDEIKVESEDEDEITETVIADTLLDVEPDPLAPATPTKKISSTQATKDRSKACDLQSETQSHTDAISHEGSDSDRDHVMESADDDYDATESQEGASKVDTNTNVTGKLSLHSREPQSSKCDKELFAKPTINRMYVKHDKICDVKRVKLSDVKRVKLSDVKRVKLSDVKRVKLSDVKHVKLSDVKRVKLSDVKRVKLSDVKHVIPVSVKGLPLPNVGVNDRLQIHKATSSFGNLPLKEIDEVRTSSETPDLRPGEISNITSRKRPHETTSTAPGHDKPLEIYIMRPKNTVLQDVFNNIARNIPKVKIDKTVDHM